MQNSEFFKLIILIFCSLGAIRVSCRTLEEELKDFCDLLPKLQIRRLAETHLETDKEFNEAVIFLQSKNWTDMIGDLQRNSAWKNLKMKLNETGLNLDHMFMTIFNLIHDLKPKSSDKKTDRSMRKFFDDFEMILPIGKILAMYHEKKQNSAVFQEFYKKISSDKVHEMFETVRQQPEMKRILIELKTMGARVEDLLDLFYGFMNWDAPSSKPKRATKNSLKDDFEDFKQLVPWNTLKRITDEYLVKDKEFGEVIRYLQSPEFAKLVNAIKIHPEYQELKEYIEDAGVDIEEIIKFFSDLILNAKPGCTDKEKIQIRKKRSFRTYLDEVQSNIPIGKFLVLYNTKMEKSENFKTFIKKISDPKVKKMVDNVRALPETRELLEKLQAFGVRIREIFIIIYAFLGWGSPFDTETH